MGEVKLEHRVASGVAWSFMEKLLTMVVQMVVSIVVARQLSPDDFGVMAILTFFTSVALAVVDSGFSQTLIRKREPTAQEYHSVLCFNVVVAILLYVVLSLVAPPLARFYGHQAIADVAPVLFLVLPINSLCVVQTVMFTREFRFKLLSNIVLLSSLVSGAVAVTMALMGCGIWSLVAQRLLQMGLKAVAFWVIRRWHSGARFSLAALRQMAPFSLRLLATDLIASIYNNVAQLFIGKMHSTTALGYYAQAQKLKDLPVISTVQAVQGVTYPALSKIADDEHKFAAGYERIVRLLAYLLFPTMLGLVAIAPEMFMLLLGQKWMPTVPYFEILALSGIFYPLSVVAYNILKVRGDGRVILRLELLKRVVMTFVLVYTIPRGVVAVAWGMTAMALVDWLMNVIASERYLRLGVGAYLRSLLPALLLAGVMFGVLHLANPHLAGLTLALRLVAKIGLGVVVYLVGSLCCGVRTLRECIDLLRGMCRRA